MYNEKMPFVKKTFHCLNVLDKRRPKSLWKWNKEMHEDLNKSQIENIFVFAPALVFNGQKMLS